MSEGKHPFACVRCSERKVKCNKQDPCSACTRYSAPCIFRPPKLRKKRERSTREDILIDRLKRYEALLQANGVGLEHIDQSLSIRQSDTKSGRESSGNVVQLATPASQATEPQETVFQPELLHEQSGSKLVDNSLWSRVAEEIHGTEDDAEGDSESDTSDFRESNADFNHVLGQNPSTTAPSHPPAKSIHRLFQIFIDNVNPLSKMVHIPTLRLAMDKAIANIAQVPRGFEALMFAIYSTAVLSLTEQECYASLSESRSVLLAEYVGATKTALSRAKFMSNTSIVVLQALMLHIISVRDTCGARATWSLTGVIIRLAELAGLHVDGTLLGLPPFETEIRRRIWWQIKMNDFRAAELCGQAKFRTFNVGETTPKPPANVEDCDLWPGMPKAPIESTRPTEMIWCKVRVDLASFAAKQIGRMQKQKPDPASFTSEEYTALDDMKVKDGFIEEIENLLETKHLRFCDPSQPLQLMVSLAGRAATNIIRFIAHHPRRWSKLKEVPASEQQFVWNVVIHLLEQYNMLQTSPQLHRFAWNAPYFIQWHAVIHVLDTLKATPLHRDAARAWHLIDNLYENNTEMLLSTKEPIFLAVGNLCLKAFSVRSAALAKQNRSVLDTPAYITRLKEQREAAKEQKALAIADRSKRMETPMQSRNHQADTFATSGLPLPATSTSNEAAQEVQTHEHSNRFRGDDAFWLNNITQNDLFEPSQNSANNMMDLDADAILAQDSWLDTPDSEAIDWAQWDAWIGSIEPVIVKPASGGAWAGFS